MSKDLHRTPDEVYDGLITEGAYEEANLDLEELSKMFGLVIADYEFGKTLRKLQKPNWRVIFNIHYDMIRELCDILMRFKKQKVGNHQGLFAFIMLNFPEVDPDWNFFERVRTVRNRNKYLGADITAEMWKGSEIEIDLFISAMAAELKKRMGR